MRKKSGSRQARWQKARRRQGLCIVCGKRPLLTKNHCGPCAVHIREAARKKNNAKTRYRGAQSYQRTQSPRPSHRTT